MGENGRGVKLTIRLYLALKLRISGALSLPPLYYRDNFALLPMTIVNFTVARRKSLISSSGFRFLQFCQHFHSHGSVRLLLPTYTLVVKP
jgi:hypothetical protein